MSSFRVLTVCTGNICRSPLAEQLLRERIGRPDEIEFSSAGTQALIGRPMDERAAAYARDLGADPSSHKARQLTVELLRGSDLVLVMSREHRSAVVQALPRASRFTFTLREFARLLAEADLLGGEELPVDPDAAAPADTQDPSSRLAALVENVAASRGMAPPVDPEEDDIVDPYRQSDEVYAASVAQLRPAVENVAAALLRTIDGDG